MDSVKQVAVITGAASGIGLALAKLCLQRGMQVVMADHDVNTLCDQVEQLSNQNDILGVVCDVSKADSLRNLTKQTMERFHRVDWLFNNAGISGHMAPLWDLTTEHIRHVMDVNLFGVIHGIQAFLPVMFKQSHRSHIINVASFYGLCSGSQMSAYAMSKHALVTMSESLYFDLQRLEKPVDVSVACPSFASTQLLTNSMPLNGNKLHELMSDLIARSRPAHDVAAHIIDAVEKNTFYILPDREVKDYCEQRTRSIIEQTSPHRHSLEKIMTSLSKRAEASAADLGLA